MKTDLDKRRLAEASLWK